MKDLIKMCCQAKVKQFVMDFEQRHNFNYIIISELFNYTILVLKKLSNNPKLFCTDATHHPYSSVMNNQIFQFKAVKLKKEK